MGLRAGGIFLLLVGFASAATAQHNRGDRGDRGGRWDRDEFEIGEVTIDRNHTYQIINTNVRVSQIRVCAYREDLDLRQLDVVLGNGRSLTLAQQDYVRERDCTRWKDLPGNERTVVQVMINGYSDRRATDVVVEGRREGDHYWNPGRTWQSWNNNQTSCGDGAGPFFTDSYNNQIPIMACPDQKPNGGPIGMSCEGLAPGTLCYGWRADTYPGFYCKAPNGKVPPAPAYIYSMYVCP